MGLIFFFFLPFICGILAILFGLTKALFVCNSALSNTVGGRDRVAAASKTLAST